MDTVEEAGYFGFDTERAYHFEVSSEGVEKMYSLACKAILEIRNE